MRFLKNKIRLSLEAQNRKKLHLQNLIQDNVSPLSRTTKEEEDKSDSYSDIQAHSPKISSPKMFNDVTESLSYNETKNIAINYGNAIIRFAKSALAVPYIESYLNQEALGISVAEFSNYMEQARSSLTGIESFRALLLVTAEDKPKLVACKRIFQWISEVFIKFFSVNWIMNGKVSQKLIYLRFRFKILRRIQKPELFTYLRNTQRPQKASIKS